MDLDDASHPIKQNLFKRLVIPALILSRGATQPPVAVTGLLLIDIGLTFGHPVGVIGQIRTLSSVIAIIFSLLMGILSIRFKHRSLLITGLTFYSVSALCCSLSPTFTALLLSYSLTGIGRAMVNPMAGALVGERLPYERRSKAFGWIFAGMAISYLVTAPVTGYLAGLGGWRFAFLGFVLPFSLASLALSIIGIPSEPESSEPQMKRGDYLLGFKSVLSSKSAVACLLAAALSEATWGSALSFSASFFRQRFLIPLNLASLLMSGIAVSCAIGSMVSGYIVNRFGRKTIAVVSALFLGIFSITYVNLNLFWFSLVLIYLNGVVAAIRYAASDSLTLEQVPEFRGTMMSANTAAYSLGSAFGTGLGGLAIIYHGYGGLGFTIGSMGIIAAAVFHVLTTDPTRN